MNPSSRCPAQPSLRRLCWSGPGAQGRDHPPVSGGLNAGSSPARQSRCWGLSTPGEGSSSTGPGLPHWPAWGSVPLCPHRPRGPGMASWPQPHPRPLAGPEPLLSFSSFCAAFVAGLVKWLALPEAVLPTMTAFTSGLGSEGAELFAQNLSKDPALQGNPGAIMQVRWHPAAPRGQWDLSLPLHSV